MTALIRLNDVNRILRTLDRQKFRLVIDYEHIDYADRRGDLSCVFFFTENRISHYFVRETKLPVAEGLVAAVVAFLTGVVFRESTTATR